jgi:carbamoyltransferase
LAIVIGFTFPESHDNAVAVVVDGKLVFAAEEERYTRHKHAQGEPPFNSLLEALRFLKKSGINPGDVDGFATNWVSSLYPLSWRIRVLKEQVDAARAVDRHIPLLGGIGSIPKHLLNWAYHDFNYVELAKLFIAKTYRRLGATLPADLKIIPVEHHLAHAASAYYFSGFSSSTVLTIDGYGERDSTVVWKVMNGEFEKLASVTVEDGSLGMLYETVSERLHFDALAGPGKVMGLAPYGKEDKVLGSKFQAIARTDEADSPYIFADEFRMKSRAMGVMDITKGYNRIADFLTKGIDLDWNPKTAPTESAANLAWHIQQFTEEIVEKTARWAKQQTKENNVALAGGVALNAKASMKLHYAHIYDNMFIFPVANDAGTAVGAAAYAHEHVFGEKMKHGRLDNIYLGSEYDDSMIKETVKRGKWSAEYLNGNLGKVADLVAKGHIIGVFQGRAEMGPRALGNRSIVADPTQADTWKRVNEMKGREYWRPLAPSLLAEDKDTYFVEPVDHRYMVLMFRMTDEGAKRTPAVCHVDATSRPQMVARETNPVWYDLIKAFKDRSGEGLVVNTSFNLAGEPLIETPQDAIKSFAIGGFDDLFLQGWLISKH